MSAAAIPVHHAKTGCLVGYFEAARLPRIAVEERYGIRHGTTLVIVMRKLDDTGALSKLLVDRASDLYGVVGFILE